MRTPPAPGSDPAPQSGDVAAEDEPRAWGDRGDGNDARLREDVPPHWG
ncbi:hypothetical protein QDR37_09505 [Amnibacterium sp. CER49]|nr:hypothetical protein [Amnibacterium sp. CER49]MDH2444179.1 hypothetical protein [Amnibacterium sp. CER49]